MGFLVGTDEAGYGPNLGPLVITATVWEAPDEARPADLYSRLREIVTSDPASEAAIARPWPALHVADSKQVYHGPQGLAKLERGVLGAIGLWGHAPKTVRDLWDLLAPQDVAAMRGQPWSSLEEQDLPLEACASDLADFVPWARAELHPRGVKLVAIRSRTVFAEPFNHLLDRFGGKGAALSDLSVALLADVLAPLGPGPRWAICDKHGGRNRYAGILQHYYPEALVEPTAEGREESVYVVGHADSRTEIRFCTRAERFLPVALASMVSKYLREVAMRDFNRFWRTHVPRIAPTAGYPVDALRFKAEIAQAQASLGIADRILWRER